MSILITPDALSRLQQLRQEQKFSEEQFYPGAPTEEIRLQCERRVSDFVREVVSLLRPGTERDDIFARARALTESFTHEDNTEEREKVDDYIG